MVTAVEAAPSAAPTSTDMPGWHIVADLTPPELIASRRLKVVRFVVLLALLLVAAAGAGGYVYTKSLAKLAAQDLATEQITTEALLKEQRTYSDITALQRAIDEVRGQTATLMAADVDVDALLGEIWQALPDGMTIEEMDVTIPSTVAGANARPAAGAGVLDASGATHIGSVTLAGTGSKISDVPAFIAKLAAIPGVFDPFPASNEKVATGTLYNLQLTLTDARLSHRFDAAGGK